MGDFNPFALTEDEDAANDFEPLALPEDEDIANDNWELQEVEDEFQVQDPTQSQAQINYNLTRDLPPQKAAKMAALSRKTGWSVPLVSAQEKEAELKSQEPQWDLVEEPVTKFVAGSPENAAVSKGDVENLSLVAKVYKDSVDYFNKLSSDVKVAWPSGEAQTDLGPLYFNQYMNGDKRFDATIKNLETKLKDTKREDFFGKVVATTAEMAPMTVESIRVGTARALQAGAFAMAATAWAGPIAGLTVGGAMAAGFLVGQIETAFFIEGGHAMKELSEITNEKGEHLDPAIVKTAGSIVGVLNAGLEVIGERAMMKLVPGLRGLVGAPKKVIKDTVTDLVKKKSFQGILAKVGLGYSKAVGINVLEEAAQETVNVIAAEISKKVSAKDFKSVEMEDALTRVWSAGEKGLYGALGLSSIGSSMTLAKDAASLARANKFHDDQIQVNDAVNATELKERSPEKMEEVLDLITKGEEVYLEGDTAEQYFQIDEGGVLEKLGVTKEQIDMAAAQGQDINIKLTDVHTKLSPEEAKEFLGIIKQTPDSVSFVDSKNVNVEEELARTVEVYEEATRNERQFKDSLKRLNTEVLATGATKEYADTVTQTWGAFARRMALEGQELNATLDKIQVGLATQADIKAADRTIRGLMQPGIGPIKPPKGALQVTPEKYLVKLFDGADPSTLLHETGHIFFYEMNGMVESGAASQAMLKDWGVINSWLGVDLKEGHTRNQLEKFARGFEQYLMEGKAPSVELETAFERFKNWLTEVYKDVQAIGFQAGFDIKLTDETRGVFDRLLATDAQIENFVQENNFIVTEEEMTALNLTDKDKAHLRRLLQKGKDAAREALQKRMAKERNKNLSEWKAEAKVQSSNERVYNLHDYLTRKTKSFGPEVSEKAKRQFQQAKNKVEATEGNIRIAKAQMAVVINKTARAIKEQNLLEDNIKATEVAKNRGIVSLTKVMKVRDTAKTSKAKTQAAIRIEKLRSHVKAEKIKGNELRRATHTLKLKVARYKAAEKPVKKRVAALELTLRSRKDFMEKLRPSQKRAYPGFDVAATQVEVGEKLTQKLRFKNPLYLTKDGRAPSVLARQFGYETLSEMVTELVEAPSQQQRVKDIVHAKEQAFYADFKADDAMLSWSNGVDEYMATLGQFISKQAGIEQKVPQKLYRKEVNRIFADKPLTEALRIDQFLASMRRALRKKDKAIKAGDFQEALTAMRQARLNYEFSKKVKSLQKKTDSLNRYVQKGIKSKGTISPEFKQNLIALANRYGMSKVPFNPNKSSLIEVLKGDGKAQLDVRSLFPEWLKNEQNTKPFKELTVTELSEIDNLFHYLRAEGAGRIKDLNAYNKMSHDKLVGEMVEVSGKLRDKPKWGAHNPMRKIQDLSRDYFTRQDISTFVMKKLDGYVSVVKGAYAGLHERSITYALADAYSDKERLLGAIKKQLKAPLDQFHKSSAKQPKILTENMPVVPANMAEDGRSWTFDNVVSLALNMGAAHNKNAVMEGYGLSQESLNQLFSVLSNEDWKAVQEIWNEIDTLWPRLKAVHERVYHFAPQKVDAEAFVTPSGLKLEGGYYPLIFDSMLSRTAAQREEISVLKESHSAAFSHASTRKGMTLARKKTSGGLPPRLSLSVLAQHLDFTTQFITHEETVRDISRIFNDEVFQKMVDKKLGVEVIPRLIDSLKYVASSSGEFQGVINSWFEQQRHLATIFILGLNVSVALKQPFSVFNAGEVIGWDNYFRGVGSVLAEVFTGGYSKTKNAMDVLSTYMAGRGKTMSRELAELAQAFKPGKLGIRSFNESIAQSAVFILIRTMDFITVYPIWRGAYQKAMKDFNGDMSKATQYADSIVADTQPSSRPMDLSDFQRNKTGYMRLATMFMTYTIKYGNYQRAQYNAFREGALSFPEYMGRVVMTSIVPPILMNIMFAGLHGELPDQEDLAADVFLYQMSSLPFAREIVGGLTSVAQGKWAKGTWDTPAFTGFRLMHNLGAGTIRWAQDFDDDRKMANAAWGFFEMASFRLGVPVSQVAKKLTGGYQQTKRGEGWGFNIVLPDPKKKKRGDANLYNIIQAW